MVDAYRIQLRLQRLLGQPNQMSGGGGSMVVCCMCGDVGFADKLFRCSRCTTRLQHSYCSNYCSSSQASTQIDICDWCRYEERTSTSTSSKPQAAASHAVSRRTTEHRHRHLQANNRGEQSSRDRVMKQRDHHEESKKQAGGVPSPRTATKRYKLLKDVMC
uniref:PHD-type zinc finger plants domain-containing protein n=1 Tax=Kalanchoe fedtschenkoi TaxID=63787 RepID=A0A7N0ZR60_KALFE